MLKSRHLDNNRIHQLLLKKLISKQQLNIKGSIVDTNNRLNEVLSSFISFSSKFLPKNRLIDIYPSCFSFHFMNKSKEDRKAHIQKLDNLTLQVLDVLKMAIIISDMSIKN